MGFEGKKEFGRLMMMACPLLEDEMVHNLTTDPDEKRIFLLTNKNIETLLPKLGAIASNSSKSLRMISSMRMRMSLEKGTTSSSG